ncbi:hypothetical protein BDV95DRAFT_206509 [Massariosphaeria phaeospora]|uniref:Uncharacterized protein n=1 Tax=Massariosphaeria phaeospora TaxID=100035 RepID=A0A7C8I2F6_9PLEO|nr:hypothetical protein BDV95DRAFT_206509 [Massariosphaeria phaeospora]
MIDTFYRVFSDLWVSSPADIPRLLQTDMFNLGVTPAQSKIRALGVGMQLGSGESTSHDIAELREAFVPLFQNYARSNFRLEIRLELHPCTYSDELLDLLRALDTVFKEVGPLGGKANVSLTVDSMQCEGDMRDTREQWISTITGHFRLNSFWNREGV